MVGTLNQALVAVDRERFEEAKELVSALRRRPQGIPEHLATPFLLTTALAAVGAGYPDAARMAFQQALEQLQGGPALDPETTRVLRQLADLARAGGAADLADGVDDAIRRFSPGIPTTA